MGSAGINIRPIALNNKVAMVAGKTAHVPICLRTFFMSIGIYGSNKMNVDAYNKDVVLIVCGKYAVFAGFFSTIHRPIGAIGDGLLVLIVSALCDTGTEGD